MNHHILIFNSNCNLCSKLIQTGGNLAKRQDKKCPIMKTISTFFRKEIQENFKLFQETALARLKQKKNWK